MGACVVTLAEQTTFGNKKVSRGTIHGAASYATGGLVYVPDLTNLKLIALGGAASGVVLAEYGNTNNASTYVANYLAYGE